MSEQKTPNEIEREIEAERAQLSHTIETIQDRFTPEEVVRQISNQFRDHGGDLGRAVTRSVKENPIGLALTGVGLAWMIFGRSNSSYDSNDVGSEHRSRFLTNRDQDGFSGFDDEDELDGSEYRGSSSVRRARPLERSDYGRVSDRTYPSTRDWSRPSPEPDYDDIGIYDFDEDDDDDGRSFSERVEAARQKLADQASSAQSSVSNAAGAVGSSAKGAGEGIASGASRAAGAVSSGASSAASAVGSAASSTAGAVSSGASSVGSALSRAYSGIAAGTENMSEEARNRVIAARERAIIGREKARRAMNRGASSAGDLFEDQPLVVGALALAVGAALGGALPRTRFEDENVGQQSDSMFREAERVYRDEVRRAKSVASAVADEAKDIAKDARNEADRRTPGDKPAEHSLADAARDAGSRLEDAAREKAAEHGEIGSNSRPSGVSNMDRSTTPGKTGS